MARIDWKTIELGTRLPPTDWNDPTHVPLMLSEAVEEIGTDAGLCFFDNDGEPLPILLELETMIIDLMPLGEEAIRKGIQDRVREVAAAEGWSDALFEPGMDRYPG